MRPESATCKPSRRCARRPVRAWRRLGPGCRLRSIKRRLRASPASTIRRPACSRPSPLRATPRWLGSRSRHPGAQRRSAMPSPSSWRACRRPSPARVTSCRRRPRNCRVCSRCSGRASTTGWRRRRPRSKRRRWVSRQVSPSWPAARRRQWPRRGRQARQASAPRLNRPPPGWGRSGRVRRSRLPASSSASMRARSRRRRRRRRRRRGSRPGRAAPSTSSPRGCRRASTPTSRRWSRAFRSSWHRRCRLSSPRRPRRPLRRFSRDGRRCSSGC